jgi:hypothetical protein
MAWVRHKRINLSPPLSGEPTWLELPGRREPAVPTILGKVQSEVSGGKKRRVLAAAAIFPNGTS